MCGDNQIYGKEGGKSYAVNVVKSLRWPGAVTVHKLGKWCSIYLGDGVKKGDMSYNPIEPGEVMADPNQGDEMPEPTPLHEPVVEEAKEGDGEGDEEDA